MTGDSPMLVSSHQQHARRPMRARAVATIFARPPESVPVDLLQPFAHTEKAPSCGLSSACRLLVRVKRSHRRFPSTVRRSKDPACPSGDLDEGPSRDPRRTRRTSPRPLALEPEFAERGRSSRLIALKEVVVCRRRPPTRVTICVALTRLKPSGPRGS